jgi:hypothetical protein
VNPFQGAEKDLPREEQVHSGVAEQAREAGGRLGAEEEHVREAPPAIIDFSLLLFMF